MEGSNLVRTAACPLKNRRTHEMYALFGSFQVPVRASILFYFFFPFTNYDKSLIYVYNFIIFYLSSMLGNRYRVTREVIYEDNW